MSKLIEVPHSVCKYTCMVSGINDVYELKTGQKLPCEFMMILSGMAGFAYLKFKRAKPPYMVFWAPSIKVQYKNLKEIFGIDINIRNEGGSFANAMKILRKNVDDGNPIVIGPLDMFHLDYHEFFMKLHATAHFVLVVGYDDSAKRVYLYDCNYEKLQSLSYENLEQAWKTDEKGYLRKNSVIEFLIPRKGQSLDELTKRGLLHKANQMLNPPIRNFGILGIRKLSKEFPDWENWMNKDDYVLALKILVMFANVPPTLSREIDNFTASRKEFSLLLKELADTTKNLELKQLSSYLYNSGQHIKRLCHIILDYVDQREDKRSEIPVLLSTIAETEEKAYNSIKSIYS
jgi:hypothetical protein